jgi:uncharacterized membrane protein YeaQ/YmgE (transglycosylase-associated protein family)
MHMSSESLLIILLVGLVAGWLAGQIVQGTGLGLIGDLVFGILGAFVGSWLLPRGRIDQRDHQLDDRSDPAASHREVAARRRDAPTLLVCPKKRAG